MRNAIASAIAAAALASFALVATPALAGPRTAPAIVAQSDAALAMTLADPEQAAAFLADPAALELLATLAPAPPDGAFDAALATLTGLLALDEIRPRAQLALGVLNHRLGFSGAAQGYLLAALADGALPAEFRQRANALLWPGRSSGGGRLSGSLTTGLRYAAPGGAGALAQSPEELAGETLVQDAFVQVDMAHRFAPGFGGISWESALQAQTTRIFAADIGNPDYLALSTGPRLPLAGLGLDGGLRLLGSVDLGAIDSRLDHVAPGFSLLVDGPLAGGSFAAAFDWRQWRYYDSAASPENSLRGGRELAGRLGYDFRLSDWVAASASARFASYDARRQSDSYSEWQIGLSLNSDALPALAEETAALVSTQWLRSPSWDAAAAPAPSSRGWLQQLMQAGSGGALALSQNVSFQLEGGLSRRDTAVAEPDATYWYGRTGLAWQF